MLSTQNNLVISCTTLPTYHTGHTSVLSLYKDNHNLGIDEEQIHMLTQTIRSYIYTVTTITFKNTFCYHVGNLVSSYFRLILRRFVVI